MAKTHVKPGCHNCADAICDECDSENPLRASPTGRLVEGPSYLRDIMAMAAFDTPPGNYDEFKNRYAKGTDTGRYRGKMSDYLRQSLSGYREGQRYVFHNGHVVHENRIDDIYGRAARRFNAKVREYCRADVMFFGDYAYIERMILLRMLLGYTPHAHLLTGPYGWESGQGTGILIEYMSGSDDHPWPTRREADMISGIFVSFGCAPVYARKAADSLFGCAQYSCIVTVSKLALRNLECAMEVVGCALTITKHPGVYELDRDKDFR